MKTLQIEEKKARKLYKTASQEFKSMLEDIFGKEFFSEKVTDRIKTYEDACRELNKAPINEAEMKKNGFTDDEIVYRKLKTITEALNDGWKPDMMDTNQKKWFPVFRIEPSSPSGLVFDDSNYDCWYAMAADSSRLFFESEEKSDHAGTTFIALYAKFII